MQTHTHTQKHRAWGCLRGYLTEWPIVMVTAALHQSIQGTDGRCATGGICFNEHTHAHTHTDLYSHKDGHTNSLPHKHTHTRTHGCAPAQREGIEQPAAYVPLVREHSFMDRRGVVIGLGAAERWREAKGKNSEDGGEKG